MPNFESPLGGGTTFLDRTGRFLLRRRIPILVVWGVLTAAAAIAAGRLQFDFNFVSLFESNDPSVERFKDYRARFGITFFPWVQLGVEKKLYSYQALWQSPDTTAQRQSPPSVIRIFL